VQDVICPGRPDEILSGRVLLLWRHRFITGSYGWEIPIGKIEDGEGPAGSAAREVEEETGWRPGPLRPLLRVEPTPGSSDSVHHLFRADEARRIGPPQDHFESERVAWVPLSDIPDMIGRGEIASGTTLAALLYTLTTDGLVVR
jgi:8-oxo-dGTP pyrophosphatase MutT (NUDIX family)